MHLNNDILQQHADSKSSSCYSLVVVIFSRFVQGVLGCYYKNDAEIQEDSELQNWILDIFKYGVLSNAPTGRLQGKQWPIVPIKSTLTSSIR